MSLRDAAVLIDAALEDNITAVREALEKGIDINSRDFFGKTALMHVLFYGHTETAKLLIEKGADVNARDIVGGTALRHASLKGHTETVSILKTSGAL